MDDKLYVLLVGVKEYDPGIILDNGQTVFKTLNGSINDAVKMRAFIEKNYEPGQVEVEELYDPHSTKEKICNTFLNHLGQAGPNDAALFYFSGHGTQENAHKCFTSETDGKLESLVCYYDNKNLKNFLLADKELRYLINKVTAKGAHLTVVIDSCHSGDATRNLEIVKANYPIPIAKKSAGTYTFQQRPWEHFLFATEFTPEMISQKGLNSLIPEGPHVLFSASESNESAYEIGPGGIFTRHFLECLNRSTLNLTNQLLYDRVAMLIEYAYVQRPRLYTPPHASHLRATGFLNAPAAASNLDAMAIYNQKMGWILNRGELNGVSAGLGKIKLFDPADRTRQFDATIDTVEMNRTILNMPEGTDTKISWFADLDYLARKPVKLNFALDEAIPKEADYVISEVNALPAEQIVTDPNEQAAGYILQHLNGRYYITEKGKKYQPLSRVVNFMNSDEIATQLKHISSWQFVLGLKKETPTDKLPNECLQITYAIGKDPYTTFPVGENNQPIVFDKWELEDNDAATTLKMKLTNTLPVDLYVAVIYLDVTFAAETFLLEPSPYLLGAGESVDLSVDGYTEFNVRVHPPVIYYNRASYNERLKIIVSTKPFEVYPLLLKSLEDPPMPGEERSRSTGTEKETPKKKAIHEWTTIDVDLFMVNPFYNQIRASMLEQMLLDKTTADFALGLYFDVNPAEPLTNKSILKSEITIVEGAEQITEAGEAVKSRLLHQANYSARWNRNNYYDEARRNDPRRTRIVAQGDSWFQHPDIYDIIDHLFKIYTVRSVPTSGETLSAYFNTNERQNESFIDVLRKEKPGFYLVSGGANDLFGPSFEQLLLDKPDQKKSKNDENPGKYVSDSFALLLEKIEAIYSRLFGSLSSEFPTLITIVHGYDYPIPSDSPDTGWLGRIMIRKGITASSDRKAVVTYLLDEFNKVLQKAVAPFPATVRYLDLRNTIEKKEGELWHDELHPNRDGFQRLGLKFIKLIEDCKTTLQFPEAAAI